jgi:RND family efflux transporter MFP subunit
MSLLKQALLCLVIVALAAGGWYAYRNPATIGLARQAADEAGPHGEGGRPRRGGADRIPGLMGQGGAVNVITAAVEADERGETLTALGTAKAARSVTVFPQVTGVVTEIPFTPGAPVEAGAVLVHLDDDEQQVALDRARVALTQAEDKLARARSLAESKTIAEVALTEADAAVQMAEIEVRAAEIALSRRSVTAPFAGVTGLSDVSVGDLVQTSTEITMLDDLATIRVGFEVPERWAGRIAQDQPITATAQGLPGSEFSGRIAAIDNRIDETTRTLRVEAELHNEGQDLKAGMAITVKLAFESDKQLTVPTLSVQWDREGSYVWKVVEGAARRADIAIVRRESGTVVVEGEIEAGDRVVVEGIQRLREGAEVVDVGVEPTLTDDSGESPEPDVEPAVSGAGNPQRARS